jgi:hypothetical protein
MPEPHQKPPGVPLDNNDLFGDNSRLFHELELSHNHKMALPVQETPQNSLNHDSTPLPDLHPSYPERVFLTRHKKYFIFFFCLFVTLIIFCASFCAW